jgi:hypothetical protein
MSSLRGIAGNLPIRHLYRVDYFIASSGDVLLTVNKTYYVGRYPTIEDAQEVIKGILTKLGCNDVEARLLTLPSNINYTPVSEDVIIATMKAWDADVVFPKTLDPTFDFSKNQLVIERSGYDFSGTPTTRQLTTQFTHVVRKPYPDNTDQDLINNNRGLGELELDFAVTENNVEARLALPTHVYSGDQLNFTFEPGFTDGVTTSGSAQISNTSTLSCPPPVCNFSVYGDYAITGNDVLTVDVIAYHISASTPNTAPNGIAAVRFDLYKNDDATPFTSITTSSPTQDENKVPVYRLVYPGILIGSVLSDDDELYVRATVMPYYGPAKSSVRVDYGSSDWNTRYNDFQDVRFVFQQTDLLDVYIAPDGNDTTGDGTEENPYATVVKAMEKFSTSNSNKFQGNIYCMPGTYSYMEFRQTSTTGRDTVKSMLTIQPAPNTTGEVIFLGGNLSGTVSHNGFARNYCLRFKNIYFNYENARNADAGDTVTPGYRTVNQVGSNILCVIFDGCKFRSNPAHTTPTASSNFVFLTARRRFVINCRMEVQLPKLKGWSGCVGSSTCSIFKGNLGNFEVTTADVTCGNQCWSAQTGLWISVTSTELASISLIRDIGNGICCYNELVTTNANQNIITSDFGNNYAYICNMIYASDYDGTTATNATVRLWGDGNIQVVDNILVWHNTVSGGRCNMFYSDAGTTEILRTNISIRNNLFKRWYIKSETFAPPTPARVGNWSVMNCVDVKDNVSGFNYAGINSFPKEFTYTNYESESDTGLVVDNPYSGESGVTGGTKFSGWPRLAPDYAQELGFTVSDYCITTTRAGAFAGLYTLGCGPDRYPAVYVPEEREFTSYGSGFEFAIDCTTATTGFELSLGNTQQVTGITVTQTDNIIVNNAGGGTLLGNQLVVIPNDDSGFNIRFQPGEIFNLSNGKSKAQNFIDAYPGGYIVAYYRDPSDPVNQKRDLLTLTPYPSNVNYVLASVVAGFNLDGTVNSLTNPGQTFSGLVGGEPVRFEFYAPTFAKYTSKVIDFADVASANGQPPLNNVERIPTTPYPFLATISWSGNLGTIYMKVSNNEFSTGDFASLGTDWKPVSNGSVISATSGDYVGFVRVANKVGSGVITLTDYYNSSVIDTFDLSIT